jgi:diguanylate cyclase (GGDEF)-like protein/PAS domain S-box-containing protein
MSDVLAPGELLPLSADWFRALAETTATAIFVYDARRFLYVNPAAEELTGYSEAELLRLAPDDLMVPEHRGWLRASRLRRVGGTAAPARFELQLLRRDGERRWILFTGALIHWAGEPAGLGTAIDISERMRAEAALRRQVRFEQSVAEVTRLFLQLPVSQIPRGVFYAFERIGPLIAADRAQLFLLADGAARCACRWRSDGDPGPPTSTDFDGPVFLEKDFTYAMSFLSRREPVRIDDTATLPAEAAAERALCARLGMRAAVLVPLAGSDRLHGFLSFESFREPRHWTEDVVGMLAILAEVLTGAYERQHAELELLASRERLELAQKAGRSVVWEWDIDRDRMLLPPVSMELFGVTAEEVPKSGVELMRLIPAADQERIHEALRRTIHHGAPYLLEHRIISPGGQTRWLAVRGQLIVDDRGRRVLGVSADVTEHKLAEEALLAEQERAAVTLASIGDGVVRTDAQGRVDYLNPVAEQLTGHTLADALGRPVGEVYQLVDEATGQPRPNPVERCLAEGQVVVRLTGHSLLLRSDGEQFAVRDSAAPVRDRNGVIIGAVLVVQDVTQLRGLEREMLYLARHDSLTGLINRRELERQLETAIVTAAAGRHHCLCYLDLDEFKLVNDSCGHVAGDELLRQLTALLAGHVRSSDLLARLGGDEFGVLLRDCTLQGAAAAAENFCRTVRQFRFAWEDRIFEIGVSIGVVPITADSGSLAQVLSAADAACYVAKEHGRNRVHIYQPDDRAMAERYGEMQWVHRIQRGFEDRRFYLFQQPIRPCAGGFEMSEILLRLRGEDGEPLPTPSFIAAAERYHLIRTIDRWVVEEALHAIGRLDGERVYAINLSGQSIGDPGFLDYVLGRVRNGPVPPHRLCFEITETASIANLSRARQFIAALKEVGCRFVLDDFGSGVSSFAYLRSLPVDFLKIDGEFVRHLRTDPVQRALVQSIHQVGHLMGLVTIAESVEDEATWEALRAMGVDYGQGYWLGMPAAL